MESLLSSQLDEDALIAAVEAESQYQRIWLPPEPWWDALLAHKTTLASALHRKLVRGATWPRSAIVDVRKPGHGVRPVSLTTPEVRVLYRAIVSALIPADDRGDRSAERYAAFVLEPIRAAFTQSTGLRRIGDAQYSHVLSTDIAAFYQYIDHAVLRDELDLAGADISLVDGLVGLLSDIEGRAFGIPQRSAPSDWISELYAARIERWAIRDGFDIWRYSDDFRVGCRSYGDALRVIESLSRAARDIGLVLNDQKTTTPSFLTYLVNTANVEVHDTSAEIDPSDVEAAASSDYPADDDEQAVVDANETIRRLWDGLPVAARPEEGWDLRTLSAEQHRAVRRALNTLTKHTDPLAVPRLLSILAYQPAMTHGVVRYAEAVSTEAKDEVAYFFDRVIERLSLNEWQRAWISYGFRACGVPVNGNPTRVEWLRIQLVERANSVSAAEAAVTLAEAGLVGFKTLEGRLRTESADFAPWYLHAIAILHRAGKVTASQIGALRQSSAVAAGILGY